MLSQVKLIAEPWDIGDGWLPGRATFRCCGPSGTAGIATVRRFWHGDGDTPRNRRAACPAAAICTSGAAAAPMPASTSSPATTASRCMTSSATTGSTTRPTARTTATAQRQQQLELRRRRSDRRPRPFSLRARQMRNFMASLLLSQGVPMLLAAIDHAHPGQQQRLLPGQRPWPGCPGTLSPEQKKAFFAFTARLASNPCARPSPVLQPPQVSFRVVASRVGSQVSRTFCGLTPEGR